MNRPIKFGGRDLLMVIWGGLFTAGIVYVASGSLMVVAAMLPFGCAVSVLPAVFWRRVLGDERFEASTFWGFGLRQRLQATAVVLGAVVFLLIQGFQAVDPIDRIFGLHCAAFFVANFAYDVWLARYPPHLKEDLSG